MKLSGRPRLRSIRAWPVWMMGFGVMIWILVDIIVTPYFRGGYPDESGQRWAFFLLVVGMVLIVLPGLLVGLHKVDLKLFFLHVAVILLLVPPSLYPLLSGHQFAMVVSFLTIVLALSSFFLVKRLDKVLRSEFRSSYRYLGFFVLDPEFILFTLVAAILYGYCLDFMATDRTIEDVTVHPGRPMENENFTIIVVVDTDAELNASIKYRVGEYGEFIERNLSYQGNRTYTVLFEGLPSGAVFEYNIYLKDEQGEVVERSYREKVRVL